MTPDPKVPMCPSIGHHAIWLVVQKTILKNMKVNGKDYCTPYVIENQKCLKPQTSYFQNGTERRLKLPLNHPAVVMNTSSSGKPLHLPEESSLTRLMPHHVWPRSAAQKQRMFG